jgi:FkbM family methyltransferase
VKTIPIKAVAKPFEGDHFSFVTYIQDSSFHLSVSDKMSRSALFAVASVATVCFIQFWIDGQMIVNNFDGPASRSSNQVATPTAQRLADGCYHVFLDVGSNIGNHVRFLFEPQLYPAARIARNFFKEAFGPESERVNTDICVFSFEPNPDHYSRHEHLRRAYNSLDWRYTPIHAGVGHQTGNITFYHTGDDLGFTTKKSNCRRECRPEHVPIIRLADWIKREVADRRIPQIRNNTVIPPPRVVMKMDIEFMEYEVIPDLMLSGVLCNNIHAVMGEFHHDVQSIAYLWPMTYQGGESEWTLDREMAKQISTEWLRMMEHNLNCNTKFFMKDDESYRNDGQPLPIIQTSSNASLP